MRESQKKKVVIIEDAKGIAEGYKTMLGELDCDITVCHSGRDLQSLIDNNQTFDLALVDIMLPGDDEKYTLAECQDTGVRLIGKMLQKETCRRFYVITVRSSLKDRVVRLCKQKNAVLKFEHKLDHDPEVFQENVKSLLAQGLDASEKNLLLELGEHMDIIDGYAKMINILSVTDIEQLVVSLKSIRKIAPTCRNADLERILKRGKWLLTTEYAPNTKGVLNKEVARTIAAIEVWLTDYAEHPQKQ
jgi:CheY-like chemotaxis protein